MSITDTAAESSDSLDSALDAAFASFTDDDALDISTAPADDEAEIGDEDEVDTEDESNDGDDEDEAASEPDEGSDEDKDDAEVDADDPLVTVVVDGEEIQVPLSEALKGYQRQADYSRKTQSLAEERKSVAALQSLQQALNEDPVAALAALAQHLGVDAQIGQSEEALAALDPIERQVLELERWKQEQQAVARQAEIANTISSLKQTYDDPDLDDAELLQFAIDKNVADLDVAYRAMRFEQAQVAAKKAADDKTSKKVAAKRRAAVVSPGTNRTAKAAAKGSGEKLSIEESYDLAMQSFN